MRFEKSETKTAQRLHSSHSFASTQRIRLRQRLLFEMTLICLLIDLCSLFLFTITPLPFISHIFFVWCDFRVASFSYEIQMKMWEKKKIIFYCYLYVIFRYANYIWKLWNCLFGFHSIPLLWLSPSSNLQATVHTLTFPFHSNATANCAVVDTIIATQT